MTTPHAALVADLEDLFRKAPTAPWLELIDRLLAHFQCAVGTVHLLDPGDGLLHLAAHRGLPPTLLDKVAAIPIGKGMAGLAAERRAPVQMCNLQTDSSGDARPGARLTQMAGSLAVPMLDGERLHGVLGVAKPVAYEFTAAESELLQRIGAGIAALQRDRR